MPVSDWVVAGIWVFMLGFLISKVSPKVGDVIAIIGAILVVIFALINVVGMVQAR